MAKIGSGFGRGNITQRYNVSQGVKKENSFINQKKASGWSAGEARRVHRGRNAASVRRMRLAV